jgi:predicted phage terminase large subunit-like protein
VFGYFPIKGAPEDRVTTTSDGIRSFIPARLEDNPGIDHESYDEALRRSGSIRYRQLRHGDWIKPEGAMMRRDWLQVVDTTSRIARSLRHWDLAATAPKPGKDPDWTVGARCGLDAEGRLVVERLRRLQGSPADVEAAVRSEAELDGKAVPIYIEQEPGASGKSLIDHYQRRVLPGFTVHAARPGTSKEVRAQPLAALAENSNVLLIRDAWNGPFLDEVEAFPLGSHDDQVDAVSGALALLFPQRPARAMSAAQHRIGGITVPR